MSRWFEDFCSNSSPGYSLGNNTRQGYSEFPCLGLFNPLIRQYLFDIIRLPADTFDTDGRRIMKPCFTPSPAMNYIKAVIPIIMTIIILKLYKAGIHWFAALCVCVQSRRRPERYRKDYGGVSK